MPFLKDLLTGAGGSLVDSIGNALDKLITNDEERQMAKLEAEKLVKQHEKEMAEEVTKRHKYDMQSDSWLSKNVRPAVLVYSLVTITLFALSDGNIGDFQIGDAYIDLMGNLLMSAVLFYFGARSLDKFTASKFAKENQKSNEDEKPKFRRVDVPKVSND